jgi:competence protein ComFC
MPAPQMRRRSIYRLYQLAWVGLDWLYPPSCGGCGQARSRWCMDCQQKVQVLPVTVCRVCGQVMHGPGVCAECQDHPPAFTAMRSWADFAGPVRTALHRLKYQRDIALGEILSRHLIKMFGDLDWPVDLVAPVPIGVARKAERGYNQATFLALPLALASGKTYRPRALAKTRETRTQVGLNLVQRKENVANAFEADRRIVEGHSVLIVDDVTTTGATLQACAEALLNAGACQVFGLTLARAV